MAILVVVAHADDETLGMGGTLAKWAGNGIHATVMTLCGGRTSRDDQDTDAQLRRAGELLRFETICGSFPDQGLDLVGMTRITQVIEAHVPKYDVVYTHHVQDQNLDHRIVTQAVVTATRPPWRGQVWSMEIPGSTDQGAGMRSPLFIPNRWERLTYSHIDYKISTFEDAYPGELQESPMPRSRYKLFSRAAYWGDYVHAEYAEPFMLLRDTR